MTDIIVNNSQMERDKSFYVQMPSAKIAILVNALRLVSNDPEIQLTKLLIPDDCEKFGFAEGTHNLGELLHFLADMLEE